MLAEPGRCDEIMAMAVACVVTRAEHDRLTALTRTRHDAVGWDQYAAAGIEVVDLGAAGATGRAAALRPLPGLERAAPGTAAAFDGEPGAPRSAVAERYGPKHARARRAVDLDPRATSVAASSGRHSRPWNRRAASSPRWRRDAVFVGHPSAGPDGRAVR
jgi:hypothetical protein